MIIIIIVMSVILLVLLLLLLLLMKLIIIVMSDEYPCCRVSIIFLGFLHHFVLAKFATSSIRVYSTYP